MSAISNDVLDYVCRKEKLFETPNLSDKSEKGRKWNRDTPLLVQAIGLI